MENSIRNRKMGLAETDRNDAWTHPVVLDGKLYLRYHGSLWCYDVGEDA